MIDWLINATIFVLFFNYHLSGLFLGDWGMRREAIFRRSVAHLWISVFSILPSFKISGDFPLFRLLGFWEIFRDSIFLDVGGFFTIPPFPRFRLLGFGVIFRRSVIPPFPRSIILAFGVARLILGEITSRSRISAAIFPFVNKRCHF